MTLAGLRGRDCTRIADRHTRLGVVQTTVRCRPSCPAQRRLPDIPGGCRRRDVTPLPKPLTPPWCLHDHPDRSVDEHAMFCACATCEAAIHAQAAIIPGASIGLKTAADRIVVTLEYLDEVTGDAGRPHPRAADVRARRPCPLDPHAGRLVDGVAKPVLVVDPIQFLTADVFNRCSIRRVLRPADVPEAIWHLLDALATTDALDHDSDPLDELRKPLRCYGGLDGSGRQLRRRRPARRAVRVPRHLPRADAWRASSPPGLNRLSGTVGDRPDR
jgi:hypothetical protein